MAGAAGKAGSLVRRPVEGATQTSELWESHFLGRLVASPGVPKGRKLWNSQGGIKDKLFSPLRSLGSYDNNVSCLRTVKKPSG